MELIPLLTILLNSNVITQAITYRNSRISAIVLIIEKRVPINYLTSEIIVTIYAKINHSIGLSKIIITHHITIILNHLFFGKNTLILFPISL